MNPTPQRELRTVAAWLLIVAVALAAFVLFVAPWYRAIFSQPWQKSFVREADFQFYKVAARQIVFTLLPLIAALQVLAALKLLKASKRLRTTEAGENSVGQNS
jgi:flagellar biosynthesis protein FlhB